MSGEKRTEEADQPATAGPGDAGAPHPETTGEPGAPSGAHAPSGPSAPWGAPGTDAPAGTGAPWDAQGTDASSGTGAPWASGATKLDEPVAPREEEAQAAADPLSPHPAASAAAPEAAPEAGASAQAEPQGDESAQKPQAQAAEPPRAEAVPPRRRSGSFASKALTAIVLLAGGGALALWGGPRIAPSLPEPIAVWLTPAGTGPDMEEVMAAVDARIAEIESRANEAAQAARAAAEQAASSASARADAAGAAAAEAANRLGQLEDAIAALAGRIGERTGGEADPELMARLGEVESALSALQQSGGGAAEIEALGAAIERQARRTEELASTITAAPADVSELEKRLAALEQARAEDAENRETAVAAAEGARRAAELTGALARIDRAMVLGEPFPDALATARAATAVPPPAALKAAAASGAPTREALKANFAPAAYDAITAALASEADEGVMSGVLARFEARVTGLPNEPIAGDSAPAVLSRARAKLLEGDLDAALAGLDALPAAAEEAMADWIAGARLRSAADAALASWRAEIGSGR